ncbi:MAG: acetylserotonin O-methyltransferase [Acidobacteria bacterium]|nr:acetylserotonin O-methyltransferase [Acidobacteriota bacterium]MCA1638632.1 acetylserotonin O-methyltransferase [Acidobacteriota bacterium]
MNTRNNTAAPMLETMPPEAQLMQLVGGSFISQATYVAAKLGLADLMKEKPQTIEELAKETETHERSLYRVLRTLASVGAFREVEPKVFANTPVSETIRTDVPGSLRDMAIWMGEEPHWRVYGEMLHSVKTGKVAWEQVHGTEVFPYLFEQNRELGEIFNRAMTSFSHVTIPAILEAYDFSGAKTVADIAGGYGHLLAAVLRKNQHLKGVLFDMPIVLEGAPALLEKEAVSERVEIVAGDFFTEIPVKADVYLLKHIIHDWDDERSVKILQNIAATMNEGGKALILETVISAGNEPHFGKILDLEMMVSPGGIERTEEEYSEILAQSGLKLSRIIPTKSPLSIVEAIRAV